jgi:exosortase K
MESYFRISKFKPKGSCGYWPHIVTVTLASALWLWYQAAGNAMLLPFTWPVAKFAGLYLGTPFRFDPQSGFVSEALGIAINKSCAGVNFFLIFSSMSILMFVNRMESRKRMALFCCMALPAAYCATVLANSARIIAAALLLGTPLSSVPGLHTVLGVACYFPMLFAGYALLDRLTKKGVHP